MKFLYDWQWLLAGALGFAAAIIVVVITLLSERRKTGRELVAIRRSLGVELRQFVTMAHGAHLGFKKLAEGKAPITAIACDPRSPILSALAG
jgi:hypothetical protein